MLVPVFEPPSRNDIDVALQQGSQFEFEVNLIQN